MSEDTTKVDDTAQVQVEETERVEHDRQVILEGKSQGTGAKFWAYTKISGPGWLQSAITLGGGSLAGGLYLGVLAGYNLMWLQPLAMIMGVIMLSAIGYVTLSSGKRPFDAINEHINPVLGWGWAIATMMANLVWCMPQFALGTAAIQQNLAPGMFESGTLAEGHNGTIACVVFLFVAAGIVIWFYDSGGKGIKIFEGVLKAMVATVVISFFGVVIKMSLTGDGLEWGRILGGFVPDLSMLTKPSAAFSETLAMTGEYRAYWEELIVSKQQNVMLTAAATAVGINMTFLLPYSMLARGWDKDFRGLAIFDLSTGLFIPFMLATSCVVIASASQFHAEPARGFLGEMDSQGELIQPEENLVSGYEKLLNNRVEEELGEEKFEKLVEQQDAYNSETSPGPLEKARETLPVGDRKLAAMLVTRDAFNLANAIQPLTGRTVSQYIFGIGVLGMAISTIIILMLINGFAFCEMLGLPSGGAAHRFGCYLAGFTGAAGPFLWTGEAKVWLAVPTSLFGMMLLPIAYFTFFLMMNSRSLLGENMPTGGRRLLWNVLMGLAALLAAFGSFWSIWTNKYSMYAFAAFGAFIALALVVHFQRKSNGEGAGDEAAADS